VWRGLQQSLIDDAVDAVDQYACVLVFVPPVDILNIYLVTVNVFSLYLCFTPRLMQWVIF